jgi:hypothetical protein
LSLNVFGIDLMLIASFLLGGVLSSVFTVMIVNSFAPGVVPWLRAGIGRVPIVLNCWMDGWAQYRTMKKKPGSLVFNAATSDEFIDRSMMDNKPMTSLHGKRIMIRVEASAVPNTPDEVGEIQRILDHVDENKGLYPLLSELQDFEMFGALGHDPQTARELLARHCQVEREYMQNGEKLERDDKEIAEMIAEGVDKYMAEADLMKKNLRFLPRRAVYVDLARAVSATQLRIASQILKRYRAEIEALYRAKYGGGGDTLWKGLAIGGFVGLLAGAAGMKFLGG